MIDKIVVFIVAYSFTQKKKVIKQIKGCFYQIGFDILTMYNNIFIDFFRISLELIQLNEIILSNLN